MSSRITDESGWRRRRQTDTLPEVFATVEVPRGPWWRKFLGFLGPGYMVAVGYMDPGNWATDLAGGSQFAYTLLSVVLLSNGLAVLLQALSTRLGIVTGRDLAQACRDDYPTWASRSLWLLCELAIAACDLAEVLGSAIALQLLFGLPLLAGVLLTTFDVLLVLLLQKRGFRWLEALVLVLIGSIALCFGVELFFASPNWSQVARGLVPTPSILADKNMLYVAIGILGATVMPHNLYLHSAIVQTRAYERTPEGRREAIRWATVDSTVALTVALFINAAILILAAASFHASGQYAVGDIQQAYKLLAPTLGAPVASTLFAVALLASGQNSTLTGTLAGQIVMEGFLDIRLPAWARRLVTRLLAILPAVAVIALVGERGTGPLLILSQVILSLQLPFAIFPLVRFTSDRAKMGEFANGPLLRALSYGTAMLIAGLNAWLLFQLCQPYV